VKSLETILTASLGVLDVRGARDVMVNGIRYDSRRVMPGDLYVAIDGRDDHAVEYVPQALAAGAAVVVTDAPERMPAGLRSGSDATLVVVPDARRAMAVLAQSFYDRPADGMELFGVTGTNGKTTVTFVLRQLLAAAGRKAGLIGTLGTMIEEMIPTGYTTPEAPELAAILRGMADAGCDAVVMEVSSHALALARVDGLEFRGAVFTNLTQDHLDFHRTMEEYRDAKRLLFDRLAPESIAVVNVDDPSGEAMVARTAARVIRYGTGSGADVAIGEMDLAADGSRWRLALPDDLGGGDLALYTPLVGAFNVMNVTAAAVLGLGLGIDRGLLVPAVAALRPVPGRMESIRLGNGATAIVDYAHTPDALENVLRAARGLLAGGSLAVVFGCGGDRDRTKRPIMGELAARLADRVIVTSDNPRSEDPEAIIREIVAGVECRSSLEPIVERERAIRHALDSSRSGDLVVIAGKGHENYQIIGAERRHFDDREVVRKWDAERKTVDEVTAA
jgi:UDP-N-acetylmuramoyl-L-alanyl-D-glutamate--2,6-diaminopimelate ligase